MFSQKELQLIYGLIISTKESMIRNQARLNNMMDADEITQYRNELLNLEEKVKGELKKEYAEA